MSVKDFSTIDLIEELRCRKDVEVEYTEVHDKFTFTVNGSATILVIPDETLRKQI